MFEIIIEVGISKARIITVMVIMLTIFGFGLDLAL